MRRSKISAKGARGVQNLRSDASALLRRPWVSRLVPEDHVGRRDVEDASEQHERVQGRFALRALEQADMRPVKASV
jgi:hypothetical protein